MSIGFISPLVVVMRLVLVKAEASCFNNGGDSVITIPRHGITHYPTTTTQRISCRDACQVFVVVHSRPAPSPDREERDEDQTHPGEAARTPVRGPQSLFRITWPDRTPGASSFLVVHELFLVCINPLVEMPSGYSGAFVWISFARLIASKYVTGSVN